MKHAALIARLCEASEGSAELSAEVWTARTGEEHRVIDNKIHTTIYRYADDEPMGWVLCLTTSLSAAWEEALPRAKSLEVGFDHGFYVNMIRSDGEYITMVGKVAACVICAAILAAEGSK